MPFRQLPSTRQFAVPVPSEYVVEVPPTEIAPGSARELTLRGQVDFQLTSLTPQFNMQNVRYWSSFVLESLRVGRVEQLRGPVDLATHATIMLMNTAVPTSLAVVLRVRNKTPFVQTFAAVLHGTTPNAPSKPQFGPY